MSFCCLLFHLALNSEFIGLHEDDIRRNVLSEIVNRCRSQLNKHTKRLHRLFRISKMLACNISLPFLLSRRKITENPRRTLTISVNTISPLIRHTWKGRATACDGSTRLHRESSYLSIPPTQKISKFRRTYHVKLVNRPHSSLLFVKSKTRGVNWYGPAFVERSSSG